MNVATRPTINGVALCAGVAMLDEGLQAAMRYLGFEYRTVCYVERDSYAAAALVARMESKALGQALIWDDLTTFPSRAFRGRVHCIVAGFPCQDISVAGRREGLDGKRSGLFFKILDIADDCDAQFLFLENVSGITSATATVIHEGEELDERAAARVVGELADRGWNAEWLHLRATDVGAAHKRERWFCFAWRRLDNSAGTRCDGTWRRPAADSQGGECLPSQGRANMGDTNECGRWAQGNGHIQDRADTASQPLANASEQRRQQNTGSPSRHEKADEGRRANSDHQSASECSGLAHPEGFSERLGQRKCSTSAAGPESGIEGCGETMADSSRLPRRQRPGRERVQHSDSELEQPESQRFAQGRAEHDRVEGRYPASEHGRELGESDGTNCEGGGLEDREGRRQEPDGYAGLAGRELFAPGPADPRWPDILAEFPDLAPAIEPGVCRVVNGLAIRLDQYRADRLRCGGNGVVALQAAAAFVELIRRSGVRFE